MEERWLEEEEEEEARFLVSHHRSFIVSEDKDGCGRGCFPTSSDAQQH